MTKTHELPRLVSILDGEFAKSLGTPSDFDGHKRLMFSLDNAESNIVNDKTLPKIVALIEDIVKVKFDFRICKGGYQHEDGSFVIEVSFLVRIDSNELLAELQSYLRQHTRQESVLIIEENNDALILNLRKLNRAYKAAGKWKQVDKEIALKSPVGFTQIGDMWFVANSPDLVQVDEQKEELLAHPITNAIHEYVYVRGDFTFPASILCQSHWIPSASSYSSNPCCQSCQKTPASTQI